MAFHVLLIASLQGDGVQLPGFLQRLDAQEGEEFLALLFRVLQFFRAADLAAHIGIEDHRAHDHRVPEQPLVVPAGQLAHHAAAAGALPGDGHLVRIAAECRDIPLHPSQARLLIQVAEVRRRFRLLPADLRMGQEAQRTDPVVHRDHHDAPAGDALPVKLHFRGVAALQPAAEEPDQYRHLFAGLFGLRPYVQIQAVLAHGDLRIHMPLPAVDVVAQPGDPLHRNRREAGAVPHAGPVLTGLRRPPAVPTRRRRGERDPLESRDPRIRRFDPAYHSVFRLYLP